MDSKFIVRRLFNVIFVEAAQAMVRFKLEFPKGVQPDKDIGQKRNPSVGQGGFKKFTFGAGHI